MAERPSQPKFQNLNLDFGSGATTKNDRKMAEGGDHKFGPLTINTQSLENFGLGPNYQDLQPIGFGVHGLVVSAVDRTRNQRIAAKKIKVESQVSCKYALREVRLLCQLKHENIIKVLDVLFDGGMSLVHQGKSGAISNFSQIYTITELLDTNLNVLIAQNLLETEHIKLITYQLLRGLHYLNSANVIHRDLKPSNIFINCDTLLLKIGDFGLARIVDINYNHAGHLTADLGTYWYRAPELMISPCSYTSAVDMWSAGCVVAEMLLGKPVFTGANDVEQLRVIINSVNLSESDWSAVLRVLPNKLLHHHPMTPQHPLSHRLDNVDPAVIDLLEDMLVFDPQKRGTPLEALAHPFLQPYANPEKEPVVAKPFHIESEVDDLPAPQLRRTIYEETKKRRGWRGLRIPAPSPIDRPKVSSAMLSLKTVGETPKKPDVPTSPIMDNLVKEQRRNRRSKLSASVDLSFISLPSPSASDDKKRSPPDTNPQKVIYATKGFQSKPPQPCPWKWPTVPTEQSSQDTESSTISGPSEKNTPSTADAPTSGEQDELLFQHKVVSADSEGSRDSTERKLASVACSDRREIKVKSSRRPNDAAGQPCIRRMKPKKRGFVDVGGFDEEDFIHLGLSTGSVDSRRASDSLAMGGIETCPEKNQAAIDRELNRRNKSGSLDMTSTKVPHLQYTARPRRQRAGSKPEEETKNNKAESGTSKRPSPERKAPVITMHLQPPEPSIIPLTLSTGDGKKRGSDVGIKIIKSPRSQRRVTCLGFERAESPLTPTERRWSSAAYDRNSPSFTSERKVSFSSLSPIAGSKLDLRKNSASSDTGASPSNVSESGFIRKTPSPSFHQRTSNKSGQIVIPDTFSKYSPPSDVIKPVLDLPQNRKSASFMIGETDMGGEFQGSKTSDEITEAERALLASSPYTGTEIDVTDENNERPESVMSTLSIPAIAPPTEFATDSQESITRKVSSTTLFIEDFSTSQDSGKKRPDSTSTYASAEPSRCSSSLSIDLSCYTNKEQIKGEEEEKDQAEVSPRKQQEDWEIASQGSQKAEFTLSEILGVEEESHISPDREELETVNNKPSYTTDRHDPTGTTKVCRTEIDLIPYQITKPEIGQHHCTFTASPHMPYNSPVETEGKSPISKFEQLSIDRDKKPFASDFYFTGKEPDSGSRPCSRNSGAVVNQCIGSFENDSPKEELLLDLPSHTVPPGFSLDMPRVPLLGLGRLTQHKSEEDLVNPRAFSPRSYPDGTSPRSTVHRDSGDLTDFKQSVKENLSSLKVSIPKDLPEKRRLVKAHSTESVCSEGETSTLRSYDHVGEDLIQFSPVGEARAPSNGVGEKPSKENPIHELDLCNHCLYQGDCTSSSCAGFSGGGIGGDGSLDKNLTLLKDTGHMNPHMSSTEISLFAKQPQQHQYLQQQQPSPPQRESSAHEGANSKCSSLDELCHSKDLFNERQKMKSCDTLNQESEPTGPALPQGPRQKARPKSAKN